MSSHVKKCVPCSTGTVLIYGTYSHIPIVSNACEGRIITTFAVSLFGESTIYLVNTRNALHLVLQYSCTLVGVIVEVLGNQFQCACEGEEVSSVIYWKYLGGGRGFTV